MIEVTSLGACERRERTGVLYCRLFRLMSRNQGNRQTIVAF